MFVSFNNNTTGITNVAWAEYPSGAPELTRIFSCVFVAQSFICSVLFFYLFVRCIICPAIYGFWLIVNSRPLTSVNTWNRSPFWNALSRGFRCRWRHLSCKLRPEIDNRFTFTLIKTTMKFKQIRKDIYRFWYRNGAILLLPFWLNNQSQLFPEKHSP
jgi:hypothetical protein